MAGIINRTCPECGDPFTTNRIDRHYCSDDCRNGEPVPTVERGDFSGRGLYEELTIRDKSQSKAQRRIIGGMP